MVPGRGELPDLAGALPTLLKLTLHGYQHYKTRSLHLIQAGQKVHDDVIVIVAE